MVIYESMFGDNRQVAHAVAAGLTEAGVVAEAVEVGVAPTVIGADVDLLVVGSPNHAWSLPRPNTRRDAAAKADGPLVSQGIGVREWLGSAALPAGLRTAAYDTRGSHPKAVVAMDHASNSIEKGLAKLGGTRLAPSEHFHVADMKGPLEVGEPERAHAWGVTLARMLTG
ncbi:MAG TPA: flavodoxin/nitric oxide synthase [Ornithinibacter sp.]|nr:flavodoxin/nitric oxide synthase [Ornithinibacter sp.]